MAITRARQAEHEALAAEQERGKAKADRIDRRQDLRAWFEGTALELSTRAAAATGRGLVTAIKGLDTSWPPRSAGSRGPSPTSRTPSRPHIRPATGDRRRQSRRGGPESAPLRLPARQSQPQAVPSANSPARRWPLPRSQPAKPRSRSEIRPTGTGPNAERAHQLGSGSRTGTRRRIPRAGTGGGRVFGCPAVASGARRTLPVIAGNRSPGGTRSAMRASIRRSASTSASAQSSLDRRRGRQDGPRAPAGLDEPPDQVLVRLRLRRFFVEPLDELTRRAAREGPESVQAAQLRQMLVPGLGPHRVVAELLSVQVELAADEVHDRRGNELAWGQQAARVAEDAQLQARSRACCGDAAGPRCSAGPRRSGCSGAAALVSQTVVCDTC